MLEQMMKKWKDLEKQIFNILSEMFFLFPEDETPSLPKELYEGSISISNGSPIHLHFFIGADLAKVMAENFIGEDEITERDIVETIKEFVNMVVGNYISDIDPEGMMELGIPQVRKVDPSEVEGLKGLAQYQIDGHFLGIWIKE